MFAARPSQQPAVSGQRIEGAEEAEPLDELAHERVHRDHTFGLQLAERHVNGPFLRTGGMEAIERKVGSFADAHAGVTKQQEDITAQIIAEQQLLLKQLVLLRGQGAGQSLRGAGNVLATEQMGQFGKLCDPSQFLQNTAQEQEPIDVGDRRQRRSLRAQASQPAEDVRVTAQLMQRTNLGMIGAEIAQEVARGATVLTTRLRSECGTDGVDSAPEEVGQWMLQRSAARAIHDGVTGTGLMCWATARAYCW